MSPSQKLDSISENTYVRLGMVFALIVGAFTGGAFIQDIKQTVEATQSDLLEIKTELVTRAEVAYWLNAFSEQNPDLAVPEILPKP